jgi:hypothetical protein
MWFFRSFSQKNEKNNRATLISHTLISVAPGDRHQRMLAHEKTSPVEAGIAG